MTDFERSFSNPEIIEFHTNGSEEVDRVTVLIHNDEGSEFTLTLEAAAEHDESVARAEREGEEVDPAGCEPVFIIPGAVITPEDVDDVTASPPRLLAKYLVQQAADSEQIAS